MYKNYWWFHYFQINDVKYKKNIFTRKVYVFIKNVSAGNKFQEYGYGVWMPL